jgi:hypothetical protein
VHLDVMLAAEVSMPEAILVPSHDPDAWQRLSPAT